MELETIKPHMRGGGVVGCFVIQGVDNDKPASRNRQQCRAWHLLVVTKRCTLHISRKTSRYLTAKSLEA